jgi:hypothetical protein
VDNRTYLGDVKDLLAELRQLNWLLRDLASKHEEPSRSAARKIDSGLAVLGLGGKKFVESYADVLGKGAAALTIGAIAGFLASSGLPKELVDAVWAQLKGR